MAVQSTRAKAARKQSDTAVTRDDDPGLRRTKRFDAPTPDLPSTKLKRVIDVPRPPLKAGSDSDVLRQLEALRPSETAGAIPTKGAREAFGRLFCGLPAPLMLPLNTEKLINLQATTGESRSGIPAFWSSPWMLSMVMDLAGSFGPGGPLGFRLGPIGNSPINPSFWWQRAVTAGVWGFSPGSLFALAGPLNPTTGILSSVGPDASDWGQGDFNVLGTNSPAGPKGMLGPLDSIMGAVMATRAMTLTMSGYLLDEKTHQIVQTFVAGKHVEDSTYNVFENLSAKFSEEASQRWLLGTSYAVDTSFAPGEKQKTFRSTAPDSEIVSVLVEPDIGFTASGNNLWFPKRMNFDLEVVTDKGVEIVSSQLGQQVNLVQFQIRKGERFEVRVAPQGASYLSQPQNVRVIVTGAASHYSDLLWEDILGPEFINLWKSDSSYVDLALFTLFSDLTNISFRTYEQMLRSGNRPKDPVAFWKACVAQMMDHYHATIKGARNDAEISEALVGQAKQIVAAFTQTLTDHPMNGDEMMSMWRDTMLNTETTRENPLNLTPERAAEIPKTWLDWMNRSLDAYRRGA
jgi:hypothetical protein